MTAVRRPIGVAQFPDVRIVGVGHSDGDNEVDHEGSPMPFSCAMIATPLRPFAGDTAGGGGRRRAHPPILSSLDRRAGFRPDLPVAPAPAGPVTAAVPVAVDPGASRRRVR